MGKDPLVETVRSFNRVVTQRIGALNERYLSRRRPLGEARLLWEIGTGGGDVREIRARLGLDSGYLSRLLRSLESAGLVTVNPSPQDKRMRTARLTKKGEAERSALDRRSEAMAWSIIEPLSDRERQRLAAAMSEVQRLLVAGQVAIHVVDPAQGSAGHCLREYFAELDGRLDTGFDPAAALPLDPDEMRSPAGVFLIAFLHGEPVGCGGLKFHGVEPAELKRVWVTPSARGLGIGRRLINDLEKRAIEHGNNAVRLDTNAALTEAAALYRSAGYREIGAFNEEPHANRWFEKQLGNPSPHEEGR
jgi:DNA-binding MarR family transcriptional regulator/GNAT superfamily N-acetyltransferase